MALFRKFFYRKPPDGLLEIAERVYVFDCCFTTDVVENQNYRTYIGGIINQLQGHLPDASFMAFNFREGENQSQIGNILSDFDMTVIDYPRQYERCPVLPLEMIHHCLKSGDSWLLLSPHNVLLMHCELGGWPILAFMLAALLLYRKLYSGEQKTLDMIYRQAPRELLQLMSPLNPIPSQLRYLQYVSRRNLDIEWPPADRGLKMDCLMLRLIPDIDGSGGCRPILRIYGRDPSPDADRATKVLFSTPKRSKVVRQYKQTESELVKIDVNCHIQGDVVLECLSLDDDMEREQIMFRVMFSTSFIRSNILILTRDEIDTLWDDKDNFPKNFRAEVLFSDIDSETSQSSYEMSVMEEKDGLPIEAFAKVQEIFNNVDWIVPKSDVALNVLQKISSSKLLKEKLESISHHEKESIESVRESTKDKLKSQVPEDSIKSSPLGSSEKLTKPYLETSSKTNLAGQETDASEGVLNISEYQDAASQTESSNTTILSPQKEDEKEITLAKEKSASVSMSLDRVSKQSSDPPPDANVIPKKVYPQDLLPVVQQATQQKIISSRILQSSRSSSGLYSNSLQVSPKPIKRFHSSPSALGITALLHDHGTYSDAVSSVQGNSQQPLPSSVSFVPVPEEMKPVSTTLPHKPAPAPHSPPPPPPPPPPSPLRSVLSHCPVEPSMADKTSSSPPEHPSASTSDPSESSDPIPSPSPLPSKHSGSQDSFVVEKSEITPALNPPLPIPLSSSQSTSEPEKHYNACHLGKLPSGKSKPPVPPPPPPPLPPLGISTVVDTPLSHPPLPPVERPSFQNAETTLSAPPPPPPLPPPTRQSHFSTTNVTSAPPPPPPPPTDSSTSSSYKVVKAPPPPPPPKLPVSAASPNLPSSVPPPPPPPIASSLQVGTANSSKGPPVPPPPIPPVKGPQKANGSAQTSQVGGNNGPVPPPPGPPGPLGKGRAPPRLSSRNQGQSKKNNLKPYHWLKLTRVVQGSLWAEAQKPEEASKAPEFDMSELETLFAAAVPNAEKGAGGGQSRSRASGPKIEKVQLIDLRRAYNCEIMLTKVKVPLPDLTNSILAMDDSALDIDQVENLIKFCPTKEEMETLKGYTGDKENLGKCEQFFMELMKVPRVESKLRVFCFKIQFKTQVSDLRKNLQIVNSASEEIRSSVKLKRVMQTILSLGNALNQGTARGAAVGFRLDSLLKLTDTRSRNNKMTLMHYLCKVLAEKLPEVLDFPKDLVNLEGSSKIQLKILAEEMQAISKGLEKVVQELSASGFDGPVSDNFCKILKEFLSYAEGEVKSLASLYSFVGRNADALAQYFGEDPAKVPFEQVVMTLQNFVKMFLKAHEENCKQIELEKKKAEKEAKNEKSKTTTEARVKNSEQPVQSPHKIGTVN